ncbi:MAG: hypothetical protein M1501_00760 [Candidatus Omnitrophica bacterium]|nr:hypothetical protein [Candidatus Omnitrophota bacterium]
MKNITLSKEDIQKKEGVVILPLKKWEEIEEELEDWEMYRSENLAKEIKKVREEVKEGKVISFAEVKKKLKIS